VATLEIRATTANINSDPRTDDIHNSTDTSTYQCTQNQKACEHNTDSVELVFDIDNKTTTLTSSTPAWEDDMDNSDRFNTIFSHPQEDIGAQTMTVEMQSMNHNKISRTTREDPNAIFSGSSGLSHYGESMERLGK
jgi:hypothetical protein